MLQVLWQIWTMSPYRCWYQLKQGCRYPRSASRTFLVCFDELRSQRSPLLVPALINYVLPRSHGYHRVFSFFQTIVKSTWERAGCCVYLCCLLLEYVPPDLLRYHQRGSWPAGEVTSNSPRPQCRLRCRGPRYVSQAYSGQWCLGQLQLRVRTSPSRMLPRDEDVSVGIRNAETASVIGWFMEET